jgi:hypothetical protein
MIRTDLQDRRIQKVSPSAGHFLFILLIAAQDDRYGSGCRGGPIVWSASDAHHLGREYEGLRGFRSGLSQGKFSLYRVSGGLRIHGLHRRYDEIGSTYLVSERLAAPTDPQNHPDRPLILHSLPNPPSRPSKSSSDASRTLRPCTLAAPRLITVAEIIKRELILSYEKEGRGKGKHKAIGVWQYTETGLVPAELLDGAGRVEKEEEEVARTGELARILGGKTR